MRRWITVSQYALTRGRELGVIIVKYTLEHPTLRHALQEVPSTRIVWERMDTTDNGKQLLLFWAESDDFEAFEAAMDDDSTVTDQRTLTKFSDRRLYQVKQVEDANAQRVYPALVEGGAIVQQCTATHEGWKAQVRFPDSDALSHFYDVCEAHGLRFTLQTKYNRTADESTTNDYGLSDKQRQMLLNAVEKGYYDVPRTTDLEAVANEMDISHQAASERLRRAIAGLVDHTLAMDELVAETHSSDELDS